MGLEAVFRPRDVHVDQGPDHLPNATYEATFPGGRPLGLMLHRVDPAAARPDLFSDNGPANVERFFRNLDPGWRMPYALLVDGRGTVTQCVPLDLITPHARAFHTTHVAIGCVGDFRGRQSHDLSAVQLGALVCVCAALVQCGLIDVDHPRWLVSHDGDPAGSQATELESPGSRLPVHEVRLLVLAQLNHAVLGLSFCVDHASGLRSDGMRPRLAVAERDLEAGRLDEASAALTGLLPYVGARALRTTVLLALARAKQFMGSAALRRGGAAGPAFAAAATLLDAAAKLAPSLALQDAVRLQQLQVRRAQDRERPGAALLADFAAFQQELMRGQRQPFVVAFVDLLWGRFSAARRGYLQLLAAQRPLEGVPAGLALCRLGQADFGMADFADAVRHLEAGLNDLGAFPERDAFEKTLERAQRRLRAVA